MSDRIRVGVQLRERDGGDPGGEVDGDAIRLRNREPGRDRFVRLSAAPIRDAAGAARSDSTSGSPTEPGAPSPALGSR